ncbi:uncharacterized protein RHIMIDRAFT_238293 [Rhizopus microsporus ATCC 52813]|uniref:Beta-hexosaminidase n=1 Tax=Rhizopus microsporus ATCC 52813 TaxID=1340429 RepID=A0A2G4STA7_RHIZD|nr:uncharacterized protein RHIMIDRAFT_238293 [Rhizopus microsporus ATCC 52813]PHZ11626.1 hypothetical protein RHIMIDRAFT_238293 [Rhizopus microsporus ATCC 52813]
MKIVLFTSLFLHSTFALLLWPKPQHVKTGSTELNLDDDFYISGPSSELLEDSVNRYTRLITRDRWIPVQVQAHHDNEESDIKLKNLHVQVEDMQQELIFGVDESYTLIIPSDGSRATLKSKTVWGAIRGLETFSQLVQAHPRRDKSGQLKIKNIRYTYNTDDDQDEDDDYVYEDEEDDDEDDDSFSNLFIPSTPIEIKDRPKFFHRGIMLDTSRNYFPVKDILRTLDAMAYNKMNVFHWHITDSQSFPLKLKSVPELSLEGAYKLRQKRLIYRKSDVRKIIDYAYKRGIRVIPEIDMPAHTGSWGLSHKDIVTCAGIHYLDPSNDWSERFAEEPGTGQLNPVLQKTYDVVGNVIEEVASLFSDGWYHGGGDEPIYKCWEQDKDVVRYMQEKNATGLDLLNMFLSKELGMIQGMNKVPILWEDAVTKNDLPIPKDVVLQVWTNPVQNAIKKGYKVIASNYNFWYLDCGHGGWGGNDTSYDEQVPPEIPKSLRVQLEKHHVEDNYRPQNWGGSGGDWCSPFKTWQRVYSYDLTFNLTETEAQNVLGGEVAMWTEQTDGTSLDIRLWPRAAAAAEVLWSGRYDDKGRKRDIGDAMPRMFDWRYRLLRRGVGAEALQPLWCGQNLQMCDAQYPF